MLESGFLFIKDKLLHNLHTCIILVMLSTKKISKVVVGNVVERLWEMNAWASKGLGKSQSNPMDRDNGSGKNLC